LRDTLNLRIGRSSEPISLIDPRIIFKGAKANSGELCRPENSCCPVKLDVEFDPPVPIPELPELALPMSRSGHRLGATYSFKLRVRERNPLLSVSASSGDSSLR
jgi:hypothetical protein